MPKLIMHISIPAPIWEPFDYLLPNNADSAHLQPGIRILVPFGTRKAVGILLAIDNKSKIDLAKLKPIIEILDDQPVISPAILELCFWISSYYHHPLGDIFNNALPKLLRDGKKTVLKCSNTVCHTILDPEYRTPLLNNEQQQAVTTILAAEGFNTFLLDGVTGSGKTEVYLQVIQDVLAKGKQTLVLVPEIGLTPQTLQRFQRRFQVTIAVLHSKVTARERLNAWLMAKENLAPIVIGTRSAIFTPMLNLGIIIVDEEHDSSFKQQSGLRYSARDLAVVRGQFSNIPVILGSATPSLESIHNFDRGKYRRLVLSERAGKAVHPSFQLIDMRNRQQINGISYQLLQEIGRHLNNNDQILIFLNRRGYAPSLLCHNCGWVAECSRCDAKLTLHQSPKYLHCHYCEATHPVYKSCPKCHSEDLFAIGLGTERMEETLKNHFPQAAIVRIDRDSTSSKGVMQQMIKDIKAQNYQILLGTQMLAKGHHFPKVTMAAILNIDGGLLSSDFRASEHMAQLLIQVAGRAGRADKLGEVYIQTYNPNNPLLLDLIKNGYHAFAVNNLKERSAAKLPPYACSALLKAEAKNQQLPTDFLTAIKQHWQIKINCAYLKILGPFPPLMQRKAGFYRSHLLIHSAKRSDLHGLLNHLPAIIKTLKPNSKLKWSLDIDPIDEN
jgi:primosomal protein N' (replication factor Y)